MTTRIFLLVAVAVAALFLAVPDHARAQSRTWVAGLGDDVNPCSRTAPCKTFAGAISKTAAGGEINCVDSGAYGTVTITKSIAIVCDGAEAGVLASNSSGIVVNAAASDSVFLSGLDLQGINGAVSGVNILQAKSVRIANSKIRGFTVAGVNVVPSAAAAFIKVELVGATLHDNPGSGIIVRPTTSAKARLLLDRVHVTESGGSGLVVDGSATTGLLKAVIVDSVFASNVSAGVNVVAGGVSAHVLIDRSSSFDNSNGLAASGNGAVIRFSNMTISGNATGVLQSNSGVAQSFSTNAIVGNADNGAFGTTALK
ncbi:right-handed parallel beta-helix repeat-containing protein [Methylosinus sp. Sm6]|uniref:right-handed parallel beta-helix repeat-containing protein n=1 Tax=Methylosinus sp. Sm6 TaxID=2866948 RepID=UPI001C99480A|nr:right-handed parallel beta-helix repeat-containing protein [Methylosinus sp. Sm6]MBY6239868.1 right-handed parallel beta-helix repeat-containing protein [Methylosinus sp. Sm6]